MPKQSNRAGGGVVMVTTFSVVWRLESTDDFCQFLRVSTSRLAGQSTCVSRYVHYVLDGCRQVMSSFIFHRVHRVRVVRGVTVLYLTIPTHRLCRLADKNWKSTRYSPNWLIAQHCYVVPSSDWIQIGLT